MSLELAPQTERRVSEYAAEQQISPDEAINLLFRLAISPRQAERNDTDRVSNPAVKMAEGIRFAGFAR